MPKSTGRSDASIAGFMAILARIGLSMVSGWLAWRWWQDRETD